MTINEMKKFLDSGQCFNSYVLVSMGQDTEQMEIGNDVAMKWLNNFDGQDADGEIIHGGTALRIGR